MFQNPGIVQSAPGREGKKMSPRLEPFLPASEGVKKTGARHAPVSVQFLKKPIVS